MANPRRAATFLDDLESIIFEGNTCRQWLSSLAKRMKRAELVAKDNVIIRREYKVEMREVIQAQRALEKAMDALEPFRKMVQRREAADEDDG